MTKTLQAHIRQRLGISRSRAFTLVELLVVIGIIGLLIALIMPSMAKVRQQAEITVCKSNLRQNWSFMVMYSENNYGCMFPSKLGATSRPKSAGR